MFVYYRNKASGKLEAKYQNCDTNSTKFCDSALYSRFLSKEDLSLEVFPPSREGELGGLLAPKQLLLSDGQGKLYAITIESGRLKLVSK